MNDYELRSLYILVAIMFIVIIGNVWLSEEPHRHVTVEHIYGNGVNVYTRTFCLTDSTQVLFGTDKHRDTYISREYFDIMDNLKKETNE